MNELEKLFETASSDVFPSLDVIVEGCSEASAAFDVYGKTCVQAQVLSNNILRDYELNCKQIQLKCYTEGGTDDDFSFYEEKASKGAVGKLKAIFDKIVTLWQDIVRKVKAVVTTKICSTTAKTAVKKMKKTLDTNPKLKTIKVKAPSITTALNVIEGFRKKCNIENTQYVKTLTGTTQVKSIGGLVEDFQKSFGKAIVGKAAVCTLTLAGLIIAIEAEMDKLPTILEEVDLRETTIIKRLGATVSEDVEVGAAAAFQQAANFRVQLGKQELDTHCKYLHDMVQTAKDSISQALTGKAQILEEDEASGENRMLTVEEYFGQDESFDEGANADARSILTSVRVEYTKSVQKIKQDIRKGKYDEAAGTCKSCRQLISDAQTKVSSIPANAREAVIGGLIADIKTMANVTAAISTFTIGMSYTFNGGMAPDRKIVKSKKAYDIARKTGNKSEMARQMRIGTDRFIANGNTQHSKRVGDHAAFIGDSVVSTAATVAAIGTLVSVVSTLVALKKTPDANVVNRYFTQIYSALGAMDNTLSAFESDIRRRKKKATRKNESFDDVPSEDGAVFEGYDLDSQDEVFDEGANLDARRIFKTLEKETAAIGKDISKLVQLGSYTEASKRCDDMLKLLDSAEAQILALNVTPGSVVFGIVVQYLISSCKIVLATLLVVCAGAAGGAIGGMISTLFSGSPANLGAIVGMAAGSSMATIPAQLTNVATSLVEVVTMIINLVRSAKMRSGNEFAAADLYINTFIGAIARSRNAIYLIQKDCDNKAAGRITEDADTEEISYVEDSTGVNDFDINEILGSIM